MTVNKRRKVRKYRGSKTHGGGSMKKRRGSGHRGGVGRAGSGKRADTIKPTMIKLGIVFGKHGFKKKNAHRIDAVNVGWLETHLYALNEQGKVLEKTGRYTVDLEKIGFQKLLSGGKVTKKMDITAGYASAKAREKVEKAGGTLTTLHEEKEPDTAKKATTPEE